MIKTNYVLVCFTMEIKHSKLLPEGGIPSSNYMLLSHYGKRICFFFNGEHGWIVWLCVLVTTVQAFLVWFSTMSTFVILISAPVPS